jgi:hypothetical protein
MKICTIRLYYQAMTCNYVLHILSGYPQNEDIIVVCVLVLVCTYPPMFGDLTDVGGVWTE